MSDQLQELTARLLEAALKAGADAADAMAATGTALSIDVRQGRLEQAERAEQTEIGLRVIIGNRQACVSASDTSSSTIATLAERAVAMAREAPADPTVGLADPDQLATDRDERHLDLVDASPEPSAAALEEAALEAEAAAAAVHGVSMVDAASAAFHLRQGAIAATNGFSGTDARTSTSITCVAISGEGLGMERDWASESRVHRSDLPPAGEIGQRAGERAVARKGARKPPTGRFPVLFDERVAGGLIGHLLAAVNGSAIVRGASWLRDALGKQVLPESLTLTEDPHRPRIGQSQMFDTEGLPTARREIVRAGILTGWTLDLGTARRLGMASTGNAARGIGSPPSPSVTSIALTQGVASREDLVRDMGTGLVVTAMLGASINPTTGDYSRGASGFWVEGGEIRYPVNECTIAGNLRDILMRIIPANDARPWVSHVVPSLLAEGLTIAGQ